MNPAQPKGGRARPATLLPNPYFEWVHATNFAYYGQSEWLPVLMELQGKLNRRALTAQGFAQWVLAMQARGAGHQGWAANLRIPACYAMPGTPFGTKTPFIALLVKRKCLSQVYAGLVLRDRVRRFELGRAVAPSNTAQAQQVQLPVPWLGVAPAVVTGVIDDGIGFAHDRLFSNDGTTRIEFFWDQEQPSTVWGQWGYGTEFTKRHPVEGIDQRLSNSRYGPWVDEDEVYRLSGQADHSKPGHKPLAACRSHGAHVADLACNAPGPGTPPSRPAACARPVIAVQLPVVTVADTSGATLEPQIYNGLCYILHSAQDIATQCGMASLPVVVNVSYGLIAGPHDGSGALEAAVDKLLIEHNSAAGRRARLVLPAGNSFLSRCHAKFTVQAYGVHELRWRVLPDDWTESSVDIWLPAAANVNSLSVLITAPDGSKGTGPFTVNGGCQFLVAGSPVGLASFQAVGSTTQRARITLWLAPTADPEGKLPLAQAGLWRILVDNRAGTATIRDIEAWIQRDDTAPGYPRRGRQSYFDDAAYKRYDDGGRDIEIDDPASYVKRDGTLNAIATGTQPVVVGGFRRSDGAPARYSASGPLPPPGRGAPNGDGPDAMLPSEDSPSHRGVLSAGTRSNSCVSMQGTSVAAPQAAVALAEWMATGSSGTRSAVLQAAKLQEATLPPLPVPKPKRVRGGGGRIRTFSNRPPRREP